MVGAQSELQERGAEVTLRRGAVEVNSTRVRSSNGDKSLWCSSCRATNY
jgi:hypothetical protein